MTNIGYATLSVIPTVTGISDAVKKQLGGLDGLGKAAGKKLGDAIADGVDTAAKHAEQAASKVVAARNKEADAAGKVRVAEAQLEALRAKGIDDAARLAVAEERAAKAKRGQESAAKNLSRATTDEAAANDRLAEAKKRVEKAGDGATASGGRFSGMLGGLKAKLGETSGGIDGLGGKVKGLGSTLMSNLGLGVAGGIAGIGASVVAMGEQFAQVNKTLAFTTGATGAALESMNDSVRTIAKSTPSAMSDIATSVADVAKATQLTGQPLEDMTVRVMKLGRMGQSVDVATLTQSMRAFGVPAEQMSGQLDNIYRAAVSSGMGVGELADMALKGAPQFKQFGLSMDDTAAMMGNLYKAGVRGESVTMGMNKAMIALSKGGGDVKAKLADAVHQMDAMIKTGNTAGATEMAGSLFGVKSAGQFIAAIQAGKLNLDEMNGALDKQTNGIMQAGGAVPTMSGAWQLMKNNVMIELEPIVTKIFTAMTNGILWFRTEGVGIIQGFKKNLDWILPISAGVGAMVLAWKAWTTAITLWQTVTKAAAAVQLAFNVAMSANPIGLIVLAIVGLGTALVVAYKRSETFRNIVNGAWNGVKTVVGAVVSWFTDTAWPAIKGAWDWICDAFTTGKELIGKAVDGVKSAWQGMVDKAGEVRDWIVDKWNGIVDYFGAIPGKISAAAAGMWDGLKSGLVGVLNWISGKWNSFADSLSFDIGGTHVGVPHMPTFGGGGYTGPTPADRVAGVVHGGEFVVQATSRRSIENAFPGMLDYLNNHGALPGYQNGGRVSDPAKQFASSVDSAKYQMGGFSPTAIDCSGLVSAVVNVSTGRDPFSSRMSTPTEGAWLSALGFQAGRGAAGDLRVGWWDKGGGPNGHTAGTLPDGTNFEANASEGVVIGGRTGADSGQFTQHAFLPKELLPGGGTTGTDVLAGLGVTPSADTGTSTAPSSGGGGASVTVPDSFTGLSSEAFGLLGKGVGATSGGKDLSEFGKVAGSAVSGQVSSALGVFGVNDSPGWLKGISQLVGGISIGGANSGPLAADGGAAPLSAAPSLVNSAGSAAAGVLGSVHGGGQQAGQAPGPTNVWNIQAGNTADALKQAETLQNERRLAQLAGR